MSTHSVMEKGHSNLSNNSKNVTGSVDSKVPTVNASSESSQSIVDELFKDFISKKFRQSKDVAKPAKVDEISKLLDMEISSIQAQTKEPPAAKEKNILPDKERNERHHSASTSNASSSLKPSTESSNSAVSVTVTVPPTQNLPADIPLPPPLLGNGHVEKELDKSLHIAFTSSVTVSVSSFILCSSPSTTSVNSSTTVQTTASSGTSSFTTKTIPLMGKKMMIPKQLGCKLTTESLSLIKSNERIDRNNRVWEEGEVPSSHSGDSMKEDSNSEDGGLPSETGSINSDHEPWTTQSSSKHKKKHKHKHKKKKKKKSSKETDKKEKERSKEKSHSHSRDKDTSSAISNNTSEKENTKNSDKDKDGKKVDRRKSSDKDKCKGKGSDSESSKREGKSSDKDKSDSKTKEKEKKRKHDRSRSRTPKRSKRSKSRSRSPKRSKRSSSPRRSRYNEWDARSYSDNAKKFPKGTSSRSRSRSPKRRRSPDRKREWPKEEANDLRLQIDKTKLRKIAIANALNTMKSGQGMPVQLDMPAAKSGGKSVEELTDFCKRISEKDQEKHDHAVSDSSDDEPAAQSDDDEPLIHHPFKVREPTSNIIMNIRNAKQLPVMTPSEKQAQQSTLRLAFPVSSGSHHRASESEWVPVEKTTAPLTSTTNRYTNSQASSSSSSEPQPGPSKSIFPEVTEKVDIGAIISERLQAVRKLESNPYDVQALSTMHKAHERASQWVQSKHLPGQFTGSTGAQVMSQQEILGDKRHQAWAKKTQFTAAAPLRGGIGMFLLQKMGWKMGEGLGKNHEGSLEPLQLDIKIDRKGLSTAGDNPRARSQAAHVPNNKDLSHKHPVSALMELCNRRRWGPPGFTVVSEDGPAHKKYFLFKVKVNNVEYQPAVPSSNKKSAKAQCAAVCLQEMGLLPKDAPMNY